MLHIIYATCTHPGRRASNEDALGVEPALGLFTIADGMGGYEGGEVASRIAVDTVRRELLRQAGQPGALEAAVRAAHEEVKARRTGALAGMGSTLATLWLHQGQVAIAHVGDSRVYRLRAGELAQLTRDHSYYADLVAAGIELPPRNEHPLGHVITRALGMDGELQPDLSSQRAQRGDVYLLATDGLAEVVPAADLARLLERPPAEAARDLVAEAYRLGGRDNITAVVLRIP